jgi:hypothetical protein
LLNKPTAAVHIGAFMLTGPREEEEKEEEEGKKGGGGGEEEEDLMVLVSKAFKSVGE